MKRGKDDEKIMGPMFPRLHVNDTDKGGPKAPPRNKMALYEQLSVPSQRFSHQVPPSSQGSGNERGNFYSYQLPNRHQSEKQNGQYSDLTTPSTQVEQRKRSDEDDFTVPIFVHPVANQECVRDTNNLPLKFQKTENAENNTRQEGLNKQNDSPIDRLRTCDSEEPAISGENIITDKRNSCIPSENQNLIFDDVRNEKGSSEDRSCRSLQRGDSVSETSVVDSIPRVDMTPDDVVGIIGHRCFWKARRAIVNQQRVFAVQVFELHRLVKVQRLIASSPHLMLEDSTYTSKPVKSISTKKLLPSTYPIKPFLNISKSKPEPQKPSHKKESSAEITSFSSIQNCAPPTWGFNPPPPGPPGPPGHHQWLIPVMSPSEGLVYKPYPFVGPSLPNPTMSNFLAPPHYGAPAPPYQIPSFPPPGPHGYFPPYMNPPAFSGSSVEQVNGSIVPARIPGADVSMPRQPIVNPPAISGSSVEQVNGPPVLAQIPNADVSVPRQHAMSSDVEVQASTASSPIERREDSNAVEERNVLPLFPTCPDVGPTNPSSETNPEPDEPEREPERTTQVIKVVPHNARSATESAARIFLSIQEERRQFESA